MADRELVFTVRAKDESTAVLKAIEAAYGRAIRDLNAFAAAAGMTGVPTKGLTAALGTLGAAAGVATQATAATTAAMGTLGAAAVKESAALKAQAAHVLALSGRLSVLAAAKAAMGPALSMLGSGLGTAGAGMVSLVSGAKSAITSLVSLKTVFLGVAAVMAARNVFKEFADSDRALGQFDATLRRTGRFSAEFSAAAKAYAGALQEVGTASDEAVVDVMRFLALNDRLATKDIPRATQATVNLAAELSIDLTTAARMVGQALEGNTAAWGRQNIVLDEAAIASGKVADILGEIERKTKDSDITLRATAAGGALALRNSFSELKESLGAFVSLILDSGVMEFLDTSLKSLAKSMDAFTKSAEGKALAKDLADGITKMLGAIGLLGAALVDLPINMQGAFLLVKHFLLSFHRDLMTTIASIFDGLSAVMIRVPGLRDAGVAMAEASGEMQVQANLARGEVIKLAKAMEQNAGVERATEKVKGFIKVMEHLQTESQKAAAAVPGGVGAAANGAADAARKRAEEAAGAMQRAFVAPDASASAMWADAMLKGFTHVEDASNAAARSLAEFKMEQEAVADSGREFRVVWETPLEVGPLIAAVQRFNATAADRSNEAAEQATDVWLAFLQDTEASAVKVARMIQDQLKRFTEAVATFAGQVIDKAFEGQIRTMKDVGKIAEDILKDLVKSIIQDLVRLAAQQVVNVALSGLAGAKGGVFPGSFTPLETYAKGGVATGPTIGLVGEAGQNEAVVPLPDNRSIPVKFTGTGGGDTTEINVTVHATDAPGVQRLLSSPAGREALRAMFVQEMRTDPRFRKVARGDS